LVPGFDGLRFSGVRFTGTLLSALGLADRLPLTPQSNDCAVCSPDCQDQRNTCSKASAPREPYGRGRLKAATGSLVL
jgi:hypothetical protein